MSPNSKYQYDAIVVGSGPNGLAAAITLARKGCSVLVLERDGRIGGGTRSEELTLPGFVHDVCSAIHPLALASPFFRSLPLAEHGLKLIQPGAPLAHPLDGGGAVLMERSIADTGKALGRDGGAYGRLLRPFVESWQELTGEILTPPHLPRHPVLLGRFGLSALRPARALAESLFRDPRARALFGGLAAHSVLPLESMASASFAMYLAILGHAVGWPLIEGGSQKLGDASAGYFRTLGGAITTGVSVGCLRDLPTSRVVLLDVTPRQLDAIAGGDLDESFRRRLRRFRYGPGVFKVDWALAGPIPWTVPDCSRAATVHVGGTLGEVAAGEAAVWRGEVAMRPFVLLAQPSLFDSTRAPAGKHTAWAYCHVPHGSSVSMTDAIEAQVERFAPGFRELIMARSTFSPRQLEDHNPNCVGGDISGGANSLGQLFTRPFFQWTPYATPLKGIYLCSASTSPGGGVHGMCGHNAALAALRRELTGRS